MSVLNVDTIASQDSLLSIEKMQYIYHSESVKVQAIILKGVYI